MFPKKWVKHEWGECVYYRSILRRYCWNGFAVDILRQVNLCMLQSGYYRLRSILLPGLADDSVFDGIGIYIINGCKLKGDITFRRI